MYSVYWITACYSGNWATAATAAAASAATTINYHRTASLFIRFGSNIRLWCMHVTTNTSKIKQKQHQHEQQE